MRAELHRTEVLRLVRQSPFRPFVITFDGGERAVIEHPENIALDPTPGGRLDVSIIGAGLRTYGTFDAVSSIATLDELTQTANGRG
jgi:hypothetical protein